MPRSACLLLLALTLAGCENPVAPDRTNPYDPAFEGVRLVNPPDTLQLTGATATSVTLGWPDASSFESGYRLEGPEDAAELPPETRAYRVEGLLGTGRRSFVVRTVGDDGGLSEPSLPLTIEYPTLSGLDLPARACDRTALVLRKALLYCESRNGAESAVVAYEVRFDGADAVREVARFPAYDRIVGVLRSGEVAVEKVVAGASRRAYAVLDGATVIGAGEIASPGGALLGPSVASPDGARLAAAYAIGGDIAELATWDLRSGALVASGLGGPGLYDFAVGLHMLTDAGTLVYSAWANDLVGWSPSTGLEVWRHPEPDFPVEPLAFDSEGARVAFPSASGTVRVIDADDGRELGRGFDPFIDFVLRGPFLIGPGDFGPTFQTGLVVWDIASGEVVRGFPGHDPNVRDAVALDGDTLVLYDERSRRIERLPLRAEWRAVTD